MNSPQRLSTVNDRPIRADGRYVLYWMIAARRTRWSPALDRALALARHLRKPLVVLEALRIDRRWITKRVARFVVEGMTDQARAFRAAGVRYHAAVEATPGASAGLLEALAREAAVVVTDDFPCFFLPAMVAAAGQRLPVKLERVDGCGVLPLAAAPRAFTTAQSFRRFLQQTIRPHLEMWPESEPLRGYDLGMAELPDDIRERWPHAETLLAAPERVDSLPLPSPGPVPMKGGSGAASGRLDRFIEQRLTRYTERNHPDQESSSELSAYLHFGHLSAQELVHRVLSHAAWSAERLGPVTGSREGFYGLSEAAEAFLDECITWRELGYTFCARQPRYDHFDTLPGWALDTLNKHRSDPRKPTYSLEQLAAAETADPLWNTAQRQLLLEGTIHNYLRMLWGKRILGWSATPEQAWENLIELNNRYAIDGRDPNSYSGIAWTFGRFDRAWGPERPIFGTVRYMSSEATRKKLDLERWEDRYRAAP